MMSDDFDIPSSRCHKRAKLTVPRWSISRESLQRLEGIFKEIRTPSLSLRQSLAAELGVKPRQVQVWFRNRRQRVRLASLGRTTRDRVGIGVGGKRFHDGYRGGAASPQTTAASVDAALFSAHGEGMSLNLIPADVAQTPAPADGLALAPFGTYAAAGRPGGAIEGAPPVASNFGSAAMNEYLPGFNPRPYFGVPAATNFAPAAPALPALGPYYSKPFARVPSIGGKNPEPPASPTHAAERTTMVEELAGNASPDSVRPPHDPSLVPPMGGGALDGPCVSSMDLAPEIEDVKPGAAVDKGEATGEAPPSREVARGLNALPDMAAAADGAHVPGPPLPRVPGASEVAAGRGGSAAEVD